MILSREVTALACVPAMDVSSRMTPSTRTRTKSRFCWGVKWMSEAPNSSAFEMARLMKTTAGAFVLEVEHGRIVARLLRVGDDLLDLDDAVVDALDRELDRIGGRDADTNRDAEREPQVVREHDVGRVGDGDEDGLVLELSHGDRAVPAGKVLGEQQRDLGLDHLDVEVEILELVLLGQDARHFAARRHPQVDEDLAEPLFGRRTLLGKRLFELLRGDYTIRIRRVPSAGHGLRAAST